MMPTRFIVIATFACGACEERDAAVPAQQPEAVIRAPAVELDAVSRAHAGQTVRIVGQVGEVLDDRTFVIEKQGLFGDAAAVVVVSKRPVLLAGVPIAARHEVEVTGTVHVGVRNIERALDDDLAPAVERALDDRPVLVAREVERAAEADEWGNPDGELQ